MEIFIPLRNKIVLGFAALVVTLGLSAGIASPQSGHFVGTPTCTDEGTTLSCDGKVAGLGGTTFQINVAVTNAPASVTCTNPGGNVAPGQSFTFTAVGTGGPQPTPRNGQAKFMIATVSPSAPAGSCPNPQWIGTVVDVNFSGLTATLTLIEDNTVSDTVQVPIP